MKFVLILSLMFLTTGVFAWLSQPSANSSNRRSIAAEKETPPVSPIAYVQPDVKESGYCKNYRQIGVPKPRSPIGKIDFNNLTYPKIWQKGSVRLKNGCFGEDNYKSLGGCEFILESVDFIDFNRDGNDEALVDIGNYCAAGSSSFSHNLFIYEVKNNELKQLWSISTGSEAYCGVRGFKLEDNEIKLEVYSDCGVKKDGKLDDNCEGHGDMGAPYFTSFVFGWTGRKFGVKSRDVFPIT